MSQAEQAYESDAASALPNRWVQLARSSWCFAIAYGTNTITFINLVSKR